MLLADGSLFDAAAALAAAGGSPWLPAPRGGPPPGADTQAVALAEALDVRVPRRGNAVLTYAPSTTGGAAVDETSRRRRGLARGVGGQAGRAGRGAWSLPSIPFNGQFGVRPFLPVWMAAASSIGASISRQPERRAALRRRPKKIAILPAFGVRGEPDRAPGALSQVDPRNARFGDRGEATNRPTRQRCRNLVAFELPSLPKSGAANAGAGRVGTARRSARA